MPRQPVPPFEIWSDDDESNNKRQPSGKKPAAKRRKNSIISKVGSSSTELDNWPQLESVKDTKEITKVFSPATVDEASLGNEPQSEDDLQVPKSPPPTEEKSASIPSYLRQELLPLENSEKSDLQALVPEDTCLAPILSDSLCTPNSPYSPTIKDVVPDTPPQMNSIFNLFEVEPLNPIELPSEVTQDAPESKNEDLPTLSQLFELAPGPAYTIKAAKNKEVLVVGDLPAPESIVEGMQPDAVSIISDGEREQSMASHRSDDKVTDNDTIQRRYPSRTRNPHALFPFTRTRWIDWRTELPKGSDLKILEEPVEGFDVAATPRINPDDSEEVDEEFIPDESPKAISPLTSSDEAEDNGDDFSMVRTISISELPDNTSNFVNKRNRQTKKTTHRQKRLNRDTSISNQLSISPIEVETPSDSSSLSNLDSFFDKESKLSPRPPKKRRVARIISDSSSSEESPVINNFSSHTPDKSNAHIIELSDGSSRDESFSITDRQATKHSTKGYRKLNFLTYYSTHLKPELSGFTMPSFLRLAYRQYRRRALYSNLPLVDYPWRKPVYFISHRSHSCEKLAFHLEKLQSKSRNPSNITKIPRNPIRTINSEPKTHTTVSNYYQACSSRRRRLFNLRPKRGLDFYHKLDNSDKEIYEKRHSHPDEFFYKFTEPGFVMNSGPEWTPVETQSYHQQLETYFKNKWPINTTPPTKSTLFSRSTRGWGIFSIAIPTRNGQQCESLFTTLRRSDVQGSDHLVNLVKSLDSNRQTDFTGFRTHSVQTLKTIWRDPISHKYDRLIPTSKRRLKRKRKLKKRSQVVIIPGSDFNYGASVDTWIQSRIACNLENDNILGYPQSPLHLIQHGPDNERINTNKKNSVNISEHNSNRNPTCTILAPGMNLQNIADRLLRNSNSKDYIESYTDHISSNSLFDSFDDLDDHYGVQEIENPNSTYIRTRAKPSSTLPINLEKARRQNQVRFTTKSKVFNQAMIDSFLVNKPSAGSRESLKSRELSPKWITRLLRPYTSKQYYFDATSYVGSGQIIDLLSYVEFLNSNPFKEDPSSQTLCGLTVNPLPTLEVIGHTFDLEHNWANIENTVAPWGRWLLKEVASRMELLFDHQSPTQTKSFKATTNELFTAYRLFLVRDRLETGQNFELCISKKILEHILVLERHLCVIHEQLLQQLKTKATLGGFDTGNSATVFISIQDTVHVHMLLLDWMVRYHLTNPEKLTSLKPSMVRFCDIIFRYLAVLLVPYFLSLNDSQIAFPLPLNHTIIEGLQFLRYSIPLLTDSNTDADIDTFTFWNLANISLFNQSFNVSLDGKFNLDTFNEFVEFSWLLFSVVLHSSAFNPQGMLSINGTSNQNSINWQFLNVLFTWLTSNSAGSSDLRSQQKVSSLETALDLLSIEKVLNKINVPQFSLASHYVLVLLHRIIILNIDWNWTLDQSIICSVFEYFRFRDFLDCRLSKYTLTDSTKLFPWFLETYSGAVPSLKEIDVAISGLDFNCSHPRYHPFIIFNCMLSSYISQLAGDHAVDNDLSSSDSPDLRLVLKQADKFMSKVSPIRKMTFNLEQFDRNNLLQPSLTRHTTIGIPDQIVSLGGLITIRLLFFHGISLKVKPPAIQLKYFIIRLKQLVDDWSLLPVMALQVICKGFFIALNIMTFKILGASPNSSGSMPNRVFSKEVLQFISELIQFASETNQAKFDVQLKLYSHHDSEMDWISEIGQYIRETVFNMLSRPSFKQVQHIKDAFSLFHDISDILQAISPYATYIPLRNAAISILDEFLYHLVRYGQPLKVSNPKVTLVPSTIQSDDSDEFDDIDDELLDLAQQVIHPPASHPTNKYVSQSTTTYYLPQSVPSPAVDRSTDHEIAKFIYTRNLSLRLAEIIKLPRLRISSDNQTRMRTLRTYLNIKALLRRNNFTSWEKGFSEFGLDLTNPLCYEFLCQSLYNRHLIVDIFWMTAIVDKQIITETCFFRYIAYLWPCDIFTASTVRQELLTLSVVKSFTLQSPQHSNPGLLKLFQGTEWQNFSQLIPSESSEPNIFNVDNISDVINDAKTGLVEELLTSLKDCVTCLKLSLLDNGNLTRTHTSVSQFQDHLKLVYSFLLGLNWNLESKTAPTFDNPGSRDQNSLLYHRAVDVLYEIFPLLNQITLLLELGSDHPAMIFWTTQLTMFHKIVKSYNIIESLSADSLRIWICSYSQLDYTKDSDLQSVLATWFHCLCLSPKVIRNDSTPSRKLTSALFPFAFLPSSSSKNMYMWNHHLSDLRRFVFSTIISPIFLDVNSDTGMSDWLLGTLSFLDGVISFLVDHLSQTLTHPRCFMLFCSFIQVELDSVMNALSHLALCGPEIFLENPKALHHFFQIVSCLAIYHSLVCRGNPEFFDSNRHWFLGISDLIETVLSKYHHYWISLIINNGPFGMLLPEVKVNILGDNYPIPEVISEYTQLQYTKYLDSLTIRLNRTSFSFPEVSTPSVYTSLRVNFSQRFTGMVSSSENLENFLSISLHLLIHLLPLWLSASRLNPTSRSLILAFFSAPFHHSHHQPPFFSLLPRLLDLLDPGHNLHQLLMDLFTNLGPDAYGLQRWLQMTLVGDHVDSHTSFSLYDVYL